MKLTGFSLNVASMKDSMTSGVELALSPRNGLDSTVKSSAMLLEEFGGNRKGA